MLTLATFLFALWLVFTKFRKANYAPDGDFFFFVHQNPSLSEFVQQSGVAQILPHLSVAFELAIGFGVHLFPAITSHISLLFVLVMVMLHPTVIHVYFALLPFLILTDAKICSALEQRRYTAFLKSPFFWFPLVYYTQQLAGAGYTFEIAAIVIVLTTAHLAWLVRGFRHRNLATIEFAFTGFRPIWISIALLISVLAGLRAAGFLNAPLGYSMFSAISDRGPVHRIRVHSRDECKQAAGLFYFNLTSAAKYDRNGLGDPEFCYISFPSQHGMNEIKNQICRSTSGITWGYQKKGTSDWIEENCYDRQAGGNN